MEDNVRAPLEYKYEQMISPLVEHGRRPRGRPRTRASIKQEENEITEGILNLDIENAMRQSMIEFQEKILIDERKRQEEEIKREQRIQLLSKFRNILHQLKRIGTYDKDIQTLNLILVPIIELYCESTTGHPILVNKEIYDMIMKNIRTIRLSQEELNLINDMIYVE